MSVELRYPRFDLTFFTETDNYHIVYDAKDGLTGRNNNNGEAEKVSNNFMAESVISLTTKNALEDDSAVFSFVLAGDVYWDRVLNANDAVILKIDPDTSSTKKSDNPVLLVGLISEVRLEGDYGENSKMYRITGQSFAKALMQFDLGVIQEVSVVLTDLGWLPDDAQEGIKMSGSSASQIAESLMKRFLQYMKFNFNGQGIDKFLEWELDSWTEAERLIDSTPYINYEGSLKQLIDDVTAKPFNELYFDATPEGKCRMIMRRTPFDKSDWEKLQTYTVTSAEVISESVAVNDTEAYSIFNISINNLYGTDSMMLGSKPQVFPDLVSKYGYKKLEVPNRYLEGAIIDKSNSGDKANTKPESDNDSKESDGSTAKQMFDREYALVLNYLKGYPVDVLRVKKSNVRTSITQVDRRITDNEADKIIDHYITNQALSKEDFSKFTGITEENIEEGNGKVEPTYTAVRDFLNGLDKNLGVSSIKEKLMNYFNLIPNQATSIASEYKAQGNLGKLKYEEIMENNPSDSSTVTGSDKRFVSEFTKRLANWYCENANFYSGDIVVKGDPKYRLGNRLFVQDEQNGELWEYYIESVEHSYSYTQGYITTLGVTRGLQNGGNDRFTHLWGKSEDFSGGMLGEKTLQALLDEQAEANSKNDGGSDSGGSSGKEYTAGAGTQLAVFPLDVINVTQGENGGYSHMGALAIDFSDGTPHKPYYAPFDCECVYTDSYSGVAWQSQKPVKCVDGSVTYVTLLCVHDNNWASNKVGDKKAKGEVIGHSGTAGQASGDHAHFEVSKGKWQGWSTSSAGVYFIKNPSHLYDVFSIKNNVTGKTTKIMNGGGYNWRSIDWDDKSGSGSGKKKTVGARAMATPFGLRMMRSAPVEPEEPKVVKQVETKTVVEKKPKVEVKKLPILYGNNIATEATKWGRAHSKTESTFQSAFNFGANTDKDPFEEDIIATDSAGFVWWCFYHAGISLSGGARMVTTRSLLYDNQLQTISTRGQKSLELFDKMKVGDLVWFNRASHVGIYCGEGKMVSCNGKGNMDESPKTGIVIVDMSKGYWWNAFDGNVRRYK